jgi:serine/threonine protein kinase
MEMLLKRFEREAKLLGRLSHPNIVGVIDYGEHEGLPYLVMVYVSGGTLKQFLGKPIPWKRAVELILPVARALEYVHEHNIINRDVKPSNILMTEKGQPMLSDFGLVKLFGEKAASETNVSITSSGMGLGTPDYMAPEQWTGEATAQSDLYSLGVVLYEMITAHRPYMADTPAGVLVKQATESLPLPKNYVPDLPENVEAVLLKVLAKRPEDRYPTVESFADELYNLLTGREVTATAIKTEQLREMMTGQMELPAVEKTVVVRKRGFSALWGCWPWWAGSSHSRTASSLLLPPPPPPRLRFRRPHLPCSLSQPHSRRPCCRPACPRIHPLPLQPAFRRRSRIGRTSRCDMSLPGFSRWGGATIPGTSTRVPLIRSLWKGSILINMRSRMRCTPSVRMPSNAGNPSRAALVHDHPILTTMYSQIIL